MFTGLVAAMGEVLAADRGHGGLELVLRSPFADLATGESVAVDGACLTVTGLGPDWFRVRVVASSLDRTLFGGYRAGRQVNLERALRAGDRLGGHLVQGHVDGIGEVRALATRDDARLLDLGVPEAVADVSVPLGSVTVDGVSLTVNAVPEPGVIQVSLIPHTLAHTTLQYRRVGDAVHLEGDVIGKYVRAMMAGYRQGS